MDGRYIPKNACKTQDKLSSAVAYMYKHPRDGKLCVIFYRGRRKKHDHHIAYSDQERAYKAIQVYFEETRRREENRAAHLKARKAQQNAAHGLEPGAIFSHSWGYDQTNIDYYQVVATTPKTVKVRPIASETTETTGWMCGRCVPVPNKFTGPAETKRPGVMDGKPYLPMKYGWCSLWDGKPDNWSSYH